MPRFFNTTGPCDPRKHYMLPPERRMPDLMRLIRQEQYFVLHAARQTGNTTAMLALAEHLRTLGYAALWATLETCQGVLETAEAEPLWMAGIANAASMLEELLVVSRTTHLYSLSERPDGAQIANPIYREVFVRELTMRRQENLPRPWWRWQTATGGLDMPALVEAFLEWWRENAEMVEEKAAAGYLEAVPHLTFMAFLQRVVNGGGRIAREYAAGRQALDLLVEFGGERQVIELKRVPPTWGKPETIRCRGIQQLCGYLDTVGEKEGWLLIFDERAGRSWEERLWSEEVRLSRSGSFGSKWRAKGGHSVSRINGLSHRRPTSTPQSPAFPPLRSASPPAPCSPAPPPAHPGRSRP